MTLLPGEQGTLQWRTSSPRRTATAVPARQLLGRSSSVWCLRLMIKPHVLPGADGIVLQSTLGPASGKTTSPLSEWSIPAASARLVRHPLHGCRRQGLDLDRYRADGHVHDVSAEAPCAEFHKPLPRKRALMSLNASRITRLRAVQHTRTFRPASQADRRGTSGGGGVVAAAGALEMTGGQRAELERFARSHTAPARRCARPRRCRGLPRREPLRRGAQKPRTRAP